MYDIQYKPSQIHRIILQILSINIFIFGFIFTYSIFIIAYGTEALTKLLKGISVLNLITLIQDVNITELVIWTYLLGLFIILFLLMKRLKQPNKYQETFTLEQIYLTSMVGAFREGSVTLPLFIMIAVPFLLQVLLPGLVIIVAFVELLIPILLVGEIYKLSKANLISTSKNSMFIKQNSNEFIKEISKFVDHQKEYIKTLKVPETSNFMQMIHKLIIYIKIIRTIILTPLIIAYMIIIKILLIIYLVLVILLFPFFVFLLIDTDLGRFLNLIHYNFMWENPDSDIALTFWNILNDLFFQNIFSFLDSNKFFIVGFIILVCVSEIYIVVKRSSKTLISEQLEKYVLSYT